MPFKNILNLLKKRNKQKEKFAGILGKSDGELSSAVRPVPVLDDIFEESSTSIFAQFKKYSFLNIAELLEIQRTSLNKNSLFIVEILDNVVNAAIISRKGVFLDIGFLKSYSYDDLKDIYFNIVPDSKETTQEIKNSIESVVSIVAYDVVYALPKKIVIIENTNSEFREVNIRAGRFIDDAGAKDLMMRDLIFETGLSEDEIEYSAIKKPLKKGDKEIGFLVSLVEKEYFNSVNDYVNTAGFSLSKIHSIQSSLYASFSLKNRVAVMRIHVENNIAYTLHKIVSEKFEYHQYDIKEEYEALELTALQMEEVILSGNGDYYEMLKSSFLETEVSVRWWNYEYDLGQCIVRVEEGYELNNHYANILSTAYYELFNMRLALIRLGVGTKLSLYEFVAVNLSIIPIMIVIFTILGVTGWYYFENIKLKKFEAVNKEYSKYFQQKKSLNSEHARYQSNISNIKNKIATINKIIKDKIEIQDAAILYEIATKLPEDMILTEILKNKRNLLNKTEVDIITIKGKCYLERSLLNYIKRLKIKGKNVYLVDMKDSKKTRLESNEEAKMRNISKFAQDLKKQDTKNDSSSKEKTSTNTQNSDMRMLEMLMSDTGTTVEYADTLNNSFTLEIR